MTLKRFNPIRITENLYQLGTPFFPMYLSIGDDAMLIEGGTGGTVDIIIRQIQDLGIDPGRIKYIALTHTHSDHIGAINHFKHKWRHLKLLASESASRILQNKKAIEDFIWTDDFIARKMFSLGEIKEMPPKLKKYDFNVDVILNEGAVIDLGSGINWVVYSTPGHSPCQLAYYESESGTLISGDANGLYNSKMDVFWPNYFESLEKYCNTLRKLALIGSKRVALSHYGVIEQASEIFFIKALKATRDYHTEILIRIHNGEVHREIALEKADWIDSFVAHMPYRAMEEGSRALIRRSQQDADKSDLFAGI